MRVVVLSGGSGTGIGFETAVSLCSSGARVILVCRNATRAQAAVAQIQQRTRYGSIEYVLGDLESVESVHHVARAIRERTQRVNVLVHNAGILYFGADELCANGVERALAVNHIGPLLLNKLVAPLLLRSARENGAARIVHVSSSAHHKGAWRLGAHCNPQQIRNMTQTPTPKYKNPIKRWLFNGYWRYADSKLFQLMSAIAFQESLSGKDAERIRTVCVHPGLVRSEIFDKIALMQPVLHLFPWLYISPRQAAEYVSAACISDDTSVLPSSQMRWTYLVRDKVSQVAACVRDPVRRQAVYHGSLQLVEHLGTK
ncbi:putative oxidoreductase [Porphyridium purpureum]|uniref:Putative oxidoreductase n=1 Tax=Porphyridium purpureum TaxID=35688 RepID=A0A5J4YTN0_PORPP|nr:putative oxidoreductase [Porphyridium purpureum]|eukprot:POR8596..scf229_5